jgi:hypothetical protein
MVAGHLREKKGYYYAVLNYTDSLGKRKTKWISTGLKVSLQRHNHKSQQKTEPTYTKTSLFQEKGGVFFVARFGKGVVLT